MSKFTDFITFENQNAYDFAYVFEMKKNFSTPKIYTANGNLAKRWYVYFSFRDPNTGKLKRVTPIYGIANKYKTKEERLSILVVYRKKVLELLNRGYNPFEDNNDLYQKEYENKTSSIETKKEDTTQGVIATERIKESSKPIEQIEPQMTIGEALNFAIHLKQKLVSKSTVQNYTSRLNKFVKWMGENHPESKDINQVTKKHVITFLNSLLETSKARNRNNYRTDLSTLFQTLVDNEIIAINFIKKIPTLKSKPNRHQTFSLRQQTQIFEYLEENDPHLLLYIKFVAYNFLRPLEVNRLRIGDINLDNNTIRFQAKNSPLKTKIIPELLLKVLPDLTDLNPEDLLFTPDKIGGKWEANENNRRDHFSKRFKKIVKDHFGYNENHGLYSFRHTFITKVYREIRKTETPYAAKSKLMLITGHTSMSALEKYLRDIDAELPEDYSNLITN